MSEPAPGSARRLHRPEARVWALVLVLCALGALMIVRWLPAADRPTVIPWWGLAIGFAAAELYPVRLEVGRSTWSISTSDFPLVLGLMLSAPWQVVVGQTLGSLAARAIVRRRGLTKVAYNVALSALESAIAVSLFQALVHGDPRRGPMVWAAAYLCVLVVEAISFLGLVAVLAVVGAPAHGGRAGEFLRSCVVAPTALTAVALTASLVLQYDLASVVLLVVVAALVLLGYRTIGTLHRRHAALQLLYRFTEMVQQVPQDSTALGQVLGAARDLLGGEVAELVTPEDDHYVRHLLAGDEPLLSTVVAASPSWQAVDERESGLLAARGTKVAAAHAWLQAQGWHDGMVVALRRNGQVVGTLAVANRASENTFDDDQLRLFGTLANHAAVTMENTALIEKLLVEATHDALTGLVNRQQFERTLDVLLAERISGTKVAVAILDLDRFKEVNDTLGHRVGDQLLTWFGQRLEAVVPEGSVAARLGGDEFAVHVPYSGTKGDATSLLAEMLKPLWDEPFRINDLDVDVIGSVGVAVAPDDAEDAATLLQRADVAMYVAKRAGGIRTYSVEHDTNSARRLARAAHLRAAITDNRLTLHYQPKVDLVSGLIGGVEALVRWNHPHEGLVPPDEFIPLAEHTGLIVPLTEVVLDQALSECVRWEETAGLRLSMAVNISVRSLTDTAVVATVERLLREHRISPDRLTLEVTESGVMLDERRNIGVLEALAQLGVSVAVDDFGTGYSSLAYLKRLPVRQVKIDKSFVTAMQDSAADAAIVRAVIDLSRHLHLSVVAEGVESAAALQTLVEAGCDMAQGYHIGKPMPSDELVTQVLAWNRARADVVQRGTTSRLHAL